MAQAVFEPNLFLYYTPTFLKPSSFYTHLPASEDGPECSEMSAYKIQMLWDYPEESIQHSESLKSKVLNFMIKENSMNIHTIKILEQTALF
jgi:hypothetical protein